MKWLLRWIVPDSAFEPTLAERRRRMPTASRIWADAEGTIYCDHRAIR